MAGDIPQVSVSPSIQNSASLGLHSRYANGSARLSSDRRFWMTTHTYQSHGIRYARFCWGKGSETWGYVHIAGGGCSSQLVQSRRAAVDRLIGAGAELPEVLALLRSFENARPGRKSGEDI